MFRLIATLLLTLLPALGAYAQTCTTAWAAPTDGAWTDAANWTDGVPGEGDVACITEPGVYTVELASTTTSIAGFVLGGSSGTQTLISGVGFVSLTITDEARIAPNGRMEVRNGSNSNSDGLYVDGTLLVEGELVSVNPSRFFSTGGLLDIAPGGTLRIDDTTIGDEAATFRVRGLLEGVCGTNTCNVNARLDAQGGTIRASSGDLDIQGNGTIDGLTVEVAEGADLNFRSGGGEGPHYVLEGTISGAPEGDLFWSNIEVAAGPAGATLAVGGTGVQTFASSGRRVDFTSAGGAFTNTDLLLTEGNGLWLRGVTLRNESTVEARTSIRMEQGSTLENTATGVVALVESSSLSRGTEGGQLVGTGQVVARLGTASSATSRINVVVDLDGAVLASEEGATLQLGEGTLRDVELQVPEGGAISFSSSNNSGSGQFTLVGTLSGTPAGTVTLGNGGEFAAALEGATLDIGGTGLRVAPGSGRVAVLTGAGGVLTNVGLVRAEGNGATVRSGIIQNEGTVEVRGTLYLDAGGVMRNTPAGQIQLIESGGASSQDGSGRLENAGLIEALQGTASNPTRSQLRGTLRSLPGSELRTNTGAALDLDTPASRSLPADVRATGSGQFILDRNFEIEGILSPGTAARPVDTLAVSSWLIYSRVAGNPQLVIDVDEGGASDRIVFSRGTGPSFPIRPYGTLVVRVQPGYTPQVGDTFTIIRVTNTTDAFQGAFAQVVVDGAPDGLAFVAEENEDGSALLLRAVEVAADGPVAVSDITPVGGGERTLFLTGPGVPGISGARLECTECLDANGFSMIPGALIGEGTLKEARFDLTSPRAFGFYDLVLSRPGLDDLVVPITVRPFLAFGVVSETNIRGAGVRPSNYNPNGLKILHNANAPEPIYPFFAVSRPVPQVDWTIATGNPFVPSSTTLYASESAPDPSVGYVVTRVPAGGETRVEFPQRIKPEDVLFPEQEPTGPDDPRIPFGTGFFTPYATTHHVSFRRFVATVENGLRTTSNAALTDYLASVDATVEDAVTEAVGIVAASNTVYIGSPQNLLAAVLDELEVTVDVPSGLAEAAGQAFYEALDAAGGALIAENAAASNAAINTAPDAVRELFLSELAILGDRFGDGLGSSGSEQRLRPSPAGAPLADAQQGGKVTGTSGNIPIPPSPFGGALCNTRAANAATTVTKNNQAAVSGESSGGSSGSSGGAAGGGTCGSSDPNDKTTGSPYLCEFGTVEVDGVEVPRCVRYYVPLAEATEVIPYTIRFENLPQATANAEFVTITDTLDASLDPGSLEVYATSSDSTFSFDVDGQVATFRFTGIDLPPNVTPPLGEGFVSFGVRPRGGLEAGTVIENDASIVFDFNPAIATPAVVHELRAVSDLSVRVEAVPESTVGSTVSYVVRTANGRGDAAEEVQLLITPPEAPLVSVTPSAGKCAGNRPIVCDLGTLASLEDGGEGVTVEVVVQADMAGVQDLTAAVTSTAFDGYAANNQASASTNVVVVSVEDESAFPTVFTLDAVYPNPLATGATVRYGLPEAAPVEVVVYDLLGRRVTVLADGDQAAGWHETAWDAGRLASGVYLCQFRAGDVVETRKVTIVR